MFLAHDVRQIKNNTRKKWVFSAITRIAFIFFCSLAAAVFVLVGRRMSMMFCD